MSKRPRTYASITKHSLLRLPQTVIRRRGELSVREAARQIGISHQTLRRIESGEGASTRSLVQVFDWLDGT